VTISQVSASPSSPSLETLLTNEQRELFASLDSPLKIQAYLDSVKYPGEERNRCPVNVLRDQQAHCLDGALFAAAALRRLGYPPLIVDMYPQPGLDDDHVLAVFKVTNHWGAIAKSNFVGLRFREPVYRSLRELVMSYFDGFFNVNGLKTLLSYSRPVKLQKFDRYGWEWQDAGADTIETYLKCLPSTPVITPRQAEQLSPVDPISYQAGMMIVNPGGLYKPKT
jgi:hypothetical protein